MPFSSRNFEEMLRFCLYVFLQYSKELVSSPVFTSIAIVLCYSDYAKRL